jgi:hypothetical protein
MNTRHPKIFDVVVTKLQRLRPSRAHFENFSGDDRIVASAGPDSIRTRPQHSEIYLQIIPYGRQLLRELGDAVRQA